MRRRYFAKRTSLLILFQAVVLADKPPIGDDVPTVTASLLNELISSLATIAAVYHKPAATFLTGRFAASEQKAAERYVMVKSCD